MNIQEMHSWFDILQMKGSEVEFTHREKDHILNRAQLKYVNEIVYKVYIPSLYKQEKYQNLYSSAESSADGFEQIRPLIREVTVNSLSTSSGSAQAGDFRIQDIQASLNAQSVQTPYNYSSGYNGSKVMVVLGITHSNTGSRARFVKNFESHKFENNVFRQPKEHQPIYTMYGDIVRIKPDTTSGNPFLVQVIKEPLKMELEMGSAVASVDCELPNICHDEIMAIALDDAGIATRDQTLMQLNAAGKKDISIAQ